MYFKLSLVQNAESMENQQSSNQVYIFISLVKFRRFVLLLSSYQLDFVTRKQKNTSGLMIHLVFRFI